MKKLISILFFTITCNSFLFAQSESKLLEVYSITEYVDGYVIKGTDKSKLDTVQIISAKDTLFDSCNYVKLIVGHEYIFAISDIGSNMAAMPPENFLVRIRSTVVWRYGDNVKDLPVFSKNTKGLYIKKSPAGSIL